MLFGAYAPPAPESGMAAVEELERAVGRTLDIVLWYQHWDGWGSAFSPEWVDGIVAGGRIPLLTWEPWAPGSPEQPAFRLSRIADGAYDSYVEGWARSLEAYGRPLYLRPMHEMNGSWYPWAGTVNGNSAHDYVRAWRRLHGIFARVGAANVRWVWSPLVDDVPATPANAFERYYPGRATSTSSRSTATTGARRCPGSAAGGRSTRCSPRPTPASRGSGHSRCG